MYQSAQSSENRCQSCLGLGKIYEFMISKKCKVCDGDGKNKVSKYIEEGVTLIPNGTVATTATIEIIEVNQVKRKRGRPKSKLHLNNNI